MYIHTHTDTKIIIFFIVAVGARLDLKGSCDRIAGKLEASSNPTSSLEGRGRQWPAGGAMRALPSALEELPGNRGAIHLCADTPSSTTSPPKPGPSRAQATPLCTVGSPWATPGLAGLPLRGRGHEWARQLGQINT